MSKKIGDAFVSLHPDTKGFGREFREQAGPAGAEAGKHFAGSMVKSIAAGFVGLEIFGFLRESVEAGREAARQLRLTDAAIKATGGAAGLSAKEIHEYAEKMGETVGVQADVIQGAENLLLAFTNVKGQAFQPATQAIVDMTAKMNGGIVTQEGLKASAIRIGKALQDPIRGLTALNKVGVNFTAEQKKQIANYIKHNNLMGAQKVILGELNRRFAGTAAAATDPMQKAQVRWHDFKEELGNKLLPVLGQVLGILMTFMPTIMAIVSGIVDFSEHNKVLVGVIIGLTAAVWLLNIAMDANPISLIVIGLAALVVGVIYAYQHFQTFRKFVDANVHAMMVLWNLAKAVGSWLAGPFASFFVRLYQSTKKTIDFFVGLPNAIKDAMGDLGHTLYDAGADLIRGLWNGIQSLNGWLADKVRGFVNDTVPGPVKKLLGIASRSKLFAQYGRWTVQGFAYGFGAEAAATHLDLPLPRPPYPASGPRPAGAAASISNTFHIGNQDPVTLAKIVTREQAWATGV